MTIKLEIGIVKQFYDIALASSEEVVHTDNFVAFLQKFLTEVGTEESGSARNKNFFHHCVLR